MQRDPALQANPLFVLLCEQHPGPYRRGQGPPFQRHVATWRALHGPEQEVSFEQVHQPGHLAQSEFTHMDDLGITFNQASFPQLLFHLVLTYSNVEAVTVCFSETFEALAEGIKTCLWQLGGVPQQHRTDHLRAAVRVIGPAHQTDWTDRYQALMTHDGMQPTITTPAWRMKMGMSNKPIIGSSRRLTRRCRSAVAVTLWTAPRTPHGYRNWCGVASTPATRGL